MNIVHRGTFVCADLTEFNAVIAYFSNVDPPVIIERQNVTRLEIVVRQNVAGWSVPPFGQ